MNLGLSIVYCVADILNLRQAGGQNFTRQNFFGCKLYSDVCFMNNHIHESFKIVITLIECV